MKHRTNRSNKFAIFLFLFSNVLASCREIAPGGEPTLEKAANIQAFEDANRNGQFDSGEAALPDVLIAAHSNIHGTYTFSAQLTDANGETRISASYTHFFDLLAFAPCGYEPTSTTSIEAKRNVSFGFAPVETQSGIADLYILFWHDENQDGAYQSGEMPLAGEILFLDPGLTWGGYTPDIVIGPLSAQTDSGGEAVANLGNSCGEVTVTVPDGWQPSISNGFWKDGRYQVPYQAGRTNIFLGVIPKK